MSQIVDFYTVNSLKPGDVLVTTVTLHIDSAGRPVFRMYRCGYPPEQIALDDGVPQGSRLFQLEDEVAKALFPIVGTLEYVADG